MLVFDQLKKEDAQLRLLTQVVLAGLLALLAGLWWVQVVKSREYKTHLETQSYRTVRLPAARGKILDRQGVPLAENRPRYSVSLYLDELRKPFEGAYAQEMAAIRRARQAALAAAEANAHRPLTKEERRRFLITSADKEQARQQARFSVASNLVAEVGTRLQQPLTLVPTNLIQHYRTRLALPYPLLVNLEPTQLARFQEQLSTLPGVDLEMQVVRGYPHQDTAAHLLGYLRRDDHSIEGEEASYSYRLPDFRGVVGIEYGFDAELRGHAGLKSVLVNNLGYRQSEDLWLPTQPGYNVVLTIDLRLQQAAEAALRRRQGPNTRGAVVVMDVRNGDLLALASSPTPNPNHRITGFPPGEWQRLNDEQLRPEINRATQENYAPGSAFKCVVALAMLEHGLDPARKFKVEADPVRPGRGCYYLGRRKIEDTAPPGEYDFHRAFIKSSNSYFITNGLRAGAAEIVRLAQRFHFGENTGLPTRQEVSGSLPDADHLSRGWAAGDTANLCIGQAVLDVTPLQMAVMTAAIANGGTVFWPRLVQRVEPQDPLASEPPRAFAAGRVRDQLGVSTRSLQLLQQAMLADVEDNEGTGKAARLEGYRIGGKTGTAQVSDLRNRVVDHNLWFVSYAPWDSPRYAVVVMIEGGGSGGGNCAPVAQEIYRAIQQIEAGPAMAQAH